MPPAPPGEDPAPVIDDRYGDDYHRALVAAARWHAGHLRKGSGAPYVSHLLTVSAIVWEDGGDQREAIAALLHDAIEDDMASIEQIRTEFGDEVAAIVTDCTESRSGPDGPPVPWFERKVAHLDHLRSVAATDRATSTMRVVGADKLANANSMLVDHRRDPRVWDRFKGGLGGTVWYLGRMAELVSAAVPGSMVASELTDAVGSFSAMLRSESATLGSAPGRLAGLLVEVEATESHGATPHLAVELARAAASGRDDPVEALSGVVERWFGPTAPLDVGRLLAEVDELFG